MRIESVTPTGPWAAGIVALLGVDTHAADLARAEGEKAGETRWVAGARFWF